MNCRTCKQPIASHLTESDFLEENGETSAVISKNIVCPECGTMNRHYFSWEVEHPFAAAPTTALDTQ